MKVTTKQEHAFTLVELSIVLVILGLLIGGVLTGQSLIRAAEIRSVTTQYNRYMTAAMTFRDKYFALPGDMTNATSYWGAADGSTGTTTACTTTASTTALTCNGNGDGLLTSPTYSNEPYRFWQHLANAGLIEGSYDGITHGSNGYSTTAVNAPSGRISSSLWDAYWTGPLTSTTYAFDGDYGNTISFGGLVANNRPGGLVLKPEDAYNIDTKIDDGKPAIGKVVMRTAGGPFSTCVDTTTTSNLAANYLLSSNAIGCALIFRQVF